MSKSKKTYRVGVISDLHVGSLFALMSPEVKKGRKGRERQTVMANHIQRFLYGRWCEMCKHMNKDGPLDVLINLGDNVDGVNYHGRGFGTWTTVIKEQVDEARNLIGMIEFKRIIGVNGSKYHVDNNMTADEAVVSHFTPAPKSMVEYEPEFGTEVVATIGGVRFHLSHKVGATSTIHRATKINKEAMMAELNKEKYGKFDVLLRAHAHYYRDVGTPFNRGFICPCWKIRDDFSQSGSLAWDPDIGYIIFTIKDGSYDWEAKIFRLTPDLIFDEVIVK